MLCLILSRRAQEMLLQLQDEGCELARAIAYENDIPQLGKERCCHLGRRIMHAVQNSVPTRKYHE